MPWSVGKDSTTLLWLCRKAFFGRIPFPVIHIDTTYKFPEMYRYREEYAKKWWLDLIIGRNEGQVAAGMGPAKGAKLDCCNELKTNALKETIAKHGFKALLLGIRRDEHGIRAKERVFSPRDENFKWNYEDQPAELWDQFKSTTEEDNHFRVHPILHDRTRHMELHKSIGNRPILQQGRFRSSAACRAATFWSQRPQASMR